MMIVGITWSDFDMPSDRRDWLDDEEFDAAMYRYRTAPLDNPEEVVAALENVKRLIRLCFEPE
jgi:hypothetical protein